MKKYDAIIIGSGLGGLTAGAILAREGKKVLVLEKHYQAGGFATSFQRKEFKFDIALHQTGGIEKTFHKDILQKCGIYDELEFVKHKYLYEAINPDYELRVKNGDIEDLKKKLIVQFPKEKKGILLWFFLLWKMGREFYWWDKAAASSKIFFAIFLCFAPFFIPLLMVSHKISLQKILNLCTKSKKLQEALMQLKGYYADSLDIAYQIPFIGGYGYYFDGGYYIKNGGQNVTLALKEVIEKNDGEVLNNLEVEKILTEDGKAIGVKTKKQSYYCEKIIASASPFIVYEKLLADWAGSRQELEKINKMEVGPSLSQIYIGLDASVEKINKRFEDSYLVFVNGLKDDFYKDIILAFHSNVDTSAAPEGKTVLCITFLDNYKRWDLPKEEYKRKKDEELKKIFRLLQDYLPDLEKYVEVVEFGTPKTMERYTGNKFGAVYGFSQKVGQAGFDRFKNQSPLENLYFASAWTRPCGGFEGAMRAGYEVAKLISESFKK
ncbi:MAG: NAD(P)/FAD-dependent oxidoreductase [Candidatus Pacebacteria bacterium]|nr:NAD(P)/FAD-dependent oxidoreductase [Candidatus Paceibacterota bacterium]